MKTGAKAAFAGALLLAFAASSGATYSLWTDTAPDPLGVVTAGDLDIELGGLYMRERTPTIAEAARFNPLPAGYVVQPGDDIRIVQPFSTDLVGDELAAALDVQWQQAPTLPSGWTATYRVYSGDTPLSPVAAVGASTTVVEMGTGSRDYTLTIDLAVGGSAQYSPTPSNPDAAGAAAPRSSQLGTVTLALRQTNGG